MIGNLQGGLDKWNCSLSIVPSALGELGMPTVSQGTIDAVATVVSTWFQNGTTTGLSALSSISLTSIKLNRIGTDGRYADPVAMEKVYTPAVAGTASGNVAPQLTMVGTLRTRLERGRGSKGRFYMPPNATIAGISTDGRVTAVNAGVLAQAVATLVRNINSQYTAIGRVGVASDAGTGVFEHVTKVSVGRVVDTQRSRRSSFPEEYAHVTV